MSRTVAGVMGRSNWLFICSAVFSKGNLDANFSRVVWHWALTPKMPSGGHSGCRLLFWVLQVGHWYWNSR